MKKNTFMRVASALLVAVLPTTCAIAGTFAKYTTEVEASATARVAKWAFTLEGASIANDFTFDLFDYTDGNVDVNGLNDDAKVIAPGTTGEFAIDLTNNSEVNAQYTISFEETNANNIPLQYSLNGQDWVDSLAELTVTGITDVAINMGASDTVTIYWRWVFEGTTNGAHAGQTDVTDTTLGVDGTATVTIKATVLVEQVD